MIVAQVCERIDPEVLTNAYFLLVLREFGTTPEARAAILEGIDAAVHGPVAFASVSASTLGESIAALARSGYVRSPFYRMETVRRGETFMLRILETIELCNTVRPPTAGSAAAQHSDPNRNRLRRPDAPAKSG